MSKYFEFNAPLKAPGYLLPAAKQEYETAVRKIAQRTETLNTALDITGIKPETFQRLAAKLFKDKEAMYGNADYFDSKTAKEIADYVLSVYYPPVDDEIDRLDRLTFPNAIVICDAAFTTNDEWANSLRRLGIGGSDEGILNGLSHFGTLQSVYHSKIGTPLLKDEGSKAVFDRGHFLEDKVIEAFCKRTGAERIRDTRMFKSKDHHAIADIDAILQMPDGSIHIFEAKTTIKENTNAWRNGKVPPAYICQTRHYPAVLNDDRIKSTYIGCLFTIDMSLGGDYLGSQYRDDDFISRNVERDSDLEQDLLEMADMFWESYVAIGCEPNPSGEKDKDLEILNARIGPQDKSLPKLDIGINTNAQYQAQRFLDLDKKIKEITSEFDAKIKAFQDEQDQIKLNLIGMLGKHTSGYARIDDEHSYEVKYSAPSKRVVDKEKMKLVYPNAWDMCSDNKQYWDNFENAYPEAFADCISKDDSSGRRFGVKIVKSA